MWRVDKPGLDFLAKQEGCKLIAYRDVAGVWTIGVGHTAGVKSGDRLTLVQAMALLAGDVASLTRTIAALVASQKGTSQHGFNAMVSLSFNIGHTAFNSSSVLRHHLAGDWEAAAATFLLWDKAHIDGKLVDIPGLLARRKREAALYLGVDVYPRA
jgi:lysozyme